MAAARRPTNKVAPVEASSWERTSWAKTVVPSRWEDEGGSGSG
jgi:hypothetical protein